MWVGTPLALTVVAVTVSTLSGFAQSRELPSFEVASVRMASGDALFSQTLTDTRVDIAMGERLMRQARERPGARASSSTPSDTVPAVKAIESLGLKIERRRVPVEVVVVDKISRTPTEN